MKELILFCLLAPAILLAACCNDKETETLPDKQNKETNDETGKCTHVCKGSIINMYYEPKTIKAFFQSPSQGNGDLRFFVFMLEDSGNITENNWRSGSNKYDEYSKYYGDTAYFESIPITDAYTVSAMPLNSIKITADKNYDSNHPAGSDLKDIFLLKFASAENLIRSDYDTKINIAWMPFMEAAKDFEEVQLADFKTLNLPHYQIFLYFNKLPEELGTYEFTISFDFGKDPVSGREAKVAPVVVKAEFTDKDYVTIQ